MENISRRKKKRACIFTKKLLFYAILKKTDGEVAQVFAHMEKAADSQKQQEALPTRRPVENTMPVRSFYRAAPQNAPIQMLRKQVLDKGDISRSIYWDKRVGKYFTEMGAAFNTLDEYTEQHGVPKPAVTSATETPETAESVSETAASAPKAPETVPPLIPQAVDSAVAVFDKSHNGFAVTLSNKQRIGLRQTLVELNDGFFVPPFTTNPKVFSQGTEVREDRIFAMRFYAEGDMRHAMGVAAGVQNGTARATRDGSSPLSPLPLPIVVSDGGGIAQDPSVDVTVKATESRTSEKMNQAYGFTKTDNPLVHAAGLKNFEGSFGGNTGDMTRPLSAGFKRKYDLIQATFFWIPKTDIPEFADLFRKRDELHDKLFPRNKSRSSFQGKARENKLQEFNGIKARINQLIDDGKESAYNMPFFQKFLLNKSKKLTANGELRVVVAGDDIYMDAVEAAADAAAEQLDMNYIDLRKPKKYSSELTATGLNTGESFKHTRTANRDEVPATANYGDVIYVFRREPQPPPPPQPSASTSESK